jgi:hypothetical protein
MTIAAINGLFRLFPDRMSRPLADRLPVGEGALVLTLGVEDLGVLVVGADHELEVMGVTEHGPDLPIEGAAEVDLADDPLHALVRRHGAACDLADVVPEQGPAALVPSLRDRQIELLQGPVERRPDLAHPAACEHRRLRERR